MMHGLAPLSISHGDNFDLRNGEDEVFLAGPLGLGSDPVCPVHWTPLFQGQVT